MMRMVCSGVWRQAVLALSIAVSAEAQERTSVLLGVAPFLTRDRGWNFEHNLGTSVGVEHSGTRVGVRVLTTLRLGARFGYGYDASYPPSAGSAKNGFTIALHARTQPAIGGLYAFAGPERYQVLWEVGPAPAKGGTWVAAGGLGIQRGAWALEGRYGAFARARGTTRGHLDLGVLRRL